MGGRAGRLRLAVAVAVAPFLVALWNHHLLFAVLPRPLPRRRRLPQRRRVKPRPPSARGPGSPTLGSLHLPCFDRRRGLAAARDLRRGELVLRAPRAALLTSDRVTADDPRIAACVSAHRPRLSSVQVIQPPSRHQ